MQFDSFEAVADFFMACDRKLGAAILKEFQSQGPSMVADLKKRFGTCGPGWAVLSASTQAERAHQGYSPDDPLFRSGELQGLVTFEIHGESIFVGIPDGLTLKDGASAAMVLNSLNDGTSNGHIPPRPVIEQTMAEMPRFAAAFAMGVKARIGL
jgi:hypothetical protein